MTAVQTPTLSASTARAGFDGAAAVLRWLITPAVTVLAASFVLFAAVAAQPGDPATQILGTHASPAQYAALRHQLGLDRSFVVQYWTWLADAARGNFGESLTYHQGVASLIGPRLWVTLMLTLYASVMIVVVGVGLGVVGGMVPRLGPVVAAVSGLGVAIPGFVAAQVLIAVFALKLGWFPVLGSGDGFANRVWHLTLPAAALAIGASAYVAQVTRTAVSAEERKQHVETARGRGVGRVAILRKHVLRNAAIPIATVAALAVAGLLAGAIVVETAFGVGGIGSLLVTSVSSKDSNIVLAVGLVLVVVFIVTTTLIDLAQHLLDPRLRLKRERP